MAGASAIVLCIEGLIIATPCHCSHQKVHQCCHCDESKQKCRVTAIVVAVSWAWSQCVVSGSCAADTRCPLARILSSCSWGWVGGRRGRRGWSGPEMVA
ncbi:hypothetical protein HDK64DRAFT_36789 [Phyllosticta capitalensis]